MLHFRAWELGIKSLYYLRSKSVQRAGFAGGVEADNTAEPAKYRASDDRLRRMPGVSVIGRSSHLPPRGGGQVGGQPRLRLTRLFAVSAPPPNPPHKGEGLKRLNCHPARSPARAGFAVT